MVRVRNDASYANDLAYALNELRKKCGALFDVVMVLQKHMPYLKKDGTVLMFRNVNDGQLHDHIVYDGATHPLWQACLVKDDGTAVQHAAIALERR